MTKNRAITVLVLLNESPGITNFFIQLPYTVQIPILWLADFHHVILGCDETTPLTSFSWFNIRGVNSTIQKYPNEVLESLSPEALYERLKRFYQELLKKTQTEHYSASAHLSISGHCSVLEQTARVQRHFTRDHKISTRSIRDQQFKIANKSLSAKPKRLRAQGFVQVQHHASISPKETSKRHPDKFTSRELHGSTSAFTFIAVEGIIFEPSH